MTRDQILDTAFTVKNLTENEEYQYRVIAVNKKGESEPSKPSEIIKAAYPFSKCILQWLQSVLAELRMEDDTPTVVCNIIKCRYTFFFTTPVKYICSVLFGVFFFGGEAQSE